MFEKLPTEQKLKDWKFGKYYDEIRRRAYLVIYFKSRDKLVDLPLVVPFSEYSEPRTVMKKLLDYTADIDAKQDRNELEARLNNLDIDNGIYVRKVGNVEGVFILPPKTYGQSKCPIVVDQQTAETSRQAMGKRGDLEDWKRFVAEPASSSSLCMFTIALALAAIVYGEIIEDEGVIFNVAGQSGVGKTTSAIVGKSVSGQVERLFDWKATFTAMSEALAAHSDTLFVIDDTEKIPKKRDVSEVLATATHFITTGRSKAYAHMVRDKLPDLYWCCPVLTSGPCTVEEQALRDKYERTDGDRRRLIDIPIPTNNGKGIWDHLPEGEDSGKWSDKIRQAAKENYGCLIDPWVELKIANGERFVKDIKSYLKGYASDNRLLGDTGFHETITKKFGIVYAAGQKAIDAGLLPWDGDHFFEAIVHLHQSARNSIRTSEQILNSSLLSINEATGDEAKYPYVTNSKEVKFSNSDCVTGFIIESGEQRNLFITSSALERICGGQDNVNQVIHALQNVGAYVAPSDGKRGVQKFVKVGREEVRPRFVKIELNAFDAKIASLSI